MHKKLNLYKYKKLIVDFFKLRDIRFLMPIIIIFSGLKLYGYVFFFIFCIPYLIINKKKIYTSIINAKDIEKVVLIYFIFLLIETLYGSYFIKDLKIIIFWIPLIITFIGGYFKNIYDFNTNNFYRSNYLNILFKSSLYYFLIYFLLSIISFIFSEGFYSIQDNFWIGSSSAFTITSIFFYSMYQLWEKENFKLFSVYFLALNFFVLLTNMHASRFGFLYIIILSIFLFFRNIQLKQYKNGISILLIIYLTTFITFNGLQFMHNNLADIKPGSNGPYKSIPYSDSLIQNDGRKEELIKGFKKFNQYPLINRAIGTGFYTSRITMNHSKDSIIKREFVKGTKSYSLQAIIALILDTGIVGIFFLGLIYLLSFYTILRTKYNLTGRIFFCFMLGFNLMGLFVGYPLVSIAYILFLMPNGLTYNLR